MSEDHENLIDHSLSKFQTLREQARKSLTNYLTVIFPSSWKKPLQRIIGLLKLLESDQDWIAFKGEALLLFYKTHIPQDRSHTLACVENLANAFKDIWNTVSLEDWNRTLNDISHASDLNITMATLHRKRRDHLAREKEHPREIDETYLNYDCWPYLRYIIENYGESFPIQNKILHTVDLLYLGFIASDLRDAFLKIPAETSLNDVKTQLIPELLDRIVQQIDDHGFTMGLDLGRTTVYGEIIVRVENILRIRKQEIENISLRIIQNTAGNSKPVIDLIPLLLTHYGFQVLNSIQKIEIDRKRLIIWKREFEKLEEQFKKIDINIRVDNKVHLVEWLHVLSRLESTQPDMPMRIKRVILSFFDPYYFDYYMKNR